MHFEDIEQAEEVKPPQPPNQLDLTPYGILLVIAPQNALPGPHVQVVAGVSPGTIFNIDALRARLHEAVEASLQELYKQK
jgi:hypothetical protein